MVLSRVLGGSRALGRKFFVVPNILSASTCIYAPEWALVNDRTMRQNIYWDLVKFNFTGCSQSGAMDHMPTSHLKKN